MAGILTITLNPALDLATETPHVRPGPKLRCSAPRTEPGGGGINVSRAIAILGGDSAALVALGGPAGAQMSDLLGEADFELISFSAPGPTRQSFAVTDDSTGEQYRYVLPGPQWTRADLKSFERAAAQVVKGARLAVISGSMPPGVPPEWTRDLVGVLQKAGAQVLVDVSGAALEEIGKPGSPRPDVLRMDQEEGEALAGRKMADLADAASVAQTLTGQGVATRVVFAMGAQGSVMGGPEGKWHAQAADVPVRSKIGAGDSFVGGFSLAMANGLDAPTALQHGAASASAAVMTADTQLCRREDAVKLRAECPLTRL